MKFIASNSWKCYNINNKNEMSVEAYIENGHLIYDELVVQPAFRRSFYFNKNTNINGVVKHVEKKHKIR